VSSKVNRTVFEEALMSDAIRGRALRPGGLIRSAVLLAALAALLSVSQGPAVPHPPGLYGWDWRLPIGIALALGVALSLARPSQGPTAKAKAVDYFAAILGVASTILGIGAAMLIAIGFTAGIIERRIATHTLIYQLTSPVIVLYFLLMAAPAAVSGGLGLAIAGRRGWTAPRLSVAWFAVRLSTIGISCAGLLGAASASLAVYRWVM
jgi:hypothetical protein